MKNLNKKGFTLIELLAIISILAIILLIAVPAITNVIDEANKGAFGNSVLGISDQAYKELELNSMEGFESDVVTAQLPDVGEAVVINIADLEFKNKTTDWSGQIIIVNNAGNFQTFVNVTDGKRSIAGYNRNDIKNKELDPNPIQNDITILTIGEEVFIDNNILTTSGTPDSGFTVVSGS